jgi:FkbM family methyltransferase
VRYAPTAFGKRALWKSVIAPHFGWLPKDFEASTVFGSVIAGNTEDFIQRHIYYFGIWEPPLTSFIAERLQPGDVFIDVGANVGYFTLQAAKLVGESGAVVAIEASPRIFAALKSNVSLNGASNVRCVNMAVADRDATLQLYAGPADNKGGTTLIVENTAGSTLECEIAARPLGGIVTPEEWRRARLVKIDVEGAEGAVTEGLRPLLQQGRSDLEVVMEVTPRTLQLQGYSADHVLQTFRDAGFHAYRLENDYTSETYLPPTVKDRPVRIEEALTRQTDVIFSRTDRPTL